MQQLLEVEDGVGVFGFERDGDTWERCVEVGGPEADVGPFVAAADHDEIVAFRELFDGHAKPAAEEVDFDEVDIAGGQQSAFGEVRIAIGARGFVGLAEQFDNGDEIAGFAVADFNEAFAKSFGGREKFADGDWR